MAGKQNFSFEKGVPFERRMVWKTKTMRPVNLTGYTATLQVRASSTDSMVLLELTTENGGITLGGAGGIIDINVSEAQIATLGFSTAVYKLSVLSSSGKKKYLLEGKINVIPWG